MSRSHWPVIVIGGGPAAALQVRRLIDAGLAPEDILVISAVWGAPGMAFLGNGRLQSYVNELEIGDGVPELFTTPGHIQPTGHEYHGYVQRVLERSGAVRCQGIVTDLRKETAEFTVTTRTEKGVQTFLSPCVILATGTRPKRPPEWLSAAGARTYDQVYQDVQSGDAADYRDRSTLVIGSGNSAMQTASLLASVSSDVTVYAAKYLGMYPTETLDRFAWRAPSQLTWELVVKSSHRLQVCDGSRPCVRFLIYRDFELVDGSVRFAISSADNDHQMGRHSQPDLHPHLTVADTAEGWLEEWSPEKSTVVWATGCEPIYPPSDLIASLAKNADGYLDADEGGQTEQPGLYITGACAGRRSVNEMLPAQAVLT